jgi:hypothetical protein
VEDIEPVDDLRLQKWANRCIAGVGEIDDYTGDGIAIRLVQTLKNAIIPEPF